MDPAGYSFSFIGVSVCKETIHRMEEKENRKGAGAKICSRKADLS